jgi:threonine dehydrogenase-like Zn-dependent dehydrogenase
VIDAVGVDANCPTHGPAAKTATLKKPLFSVERKMIAPKTNERGDNWHPGNAPSQVLQWGVETCAKAGTFSIIGVYPQQAMNFPIGMAMNKNLTLTMGNCNHRKYVPKLIELVRSNTIDPAQVLTNVEPITSVIEAYKQFDRRQPGWIKVKLETEVASLAA